MAINKFVIESPIQILMNPKKQKFAKLNLNQYRNWHWHVLSKTKLIYLDIMTLLFLKEDFHKLRFDKIDIEYQLIAKDNRKFDAMNIVAVVDKYFQDVMVKLNVIKDDNYKVVREVTVKPVIVDKSIPENFCRITIKESIK